MASRIRGALGVVLTATMALSVGAAMAVEEIRTTTVQRVIDGDTFVVAGGERVRVRNFDTPELRRYDCRDERAAAVAARDAARRILQGRTVTLRVIGEDRYRRKIADVAVHRGSARRDFVARMVAEGHGKRWIYGREPQPEWCSREARTVELWRVVWNGVERSVSSALSGWLR